ncbi:sigma 54-interacting transcriptional regulator, partial [bacterium]|nr:sigma 54-interacting transcriptional regulator [bacterium]
ACEQLQNEIQTRQQLETSLADADQHISRLTKQEAKRWGIDAFVGQSPETEQVINEIRQLQQVEKTSVMILGESGTGKELVARAIHFGGTNSKGPFVAVNCTAINKDLAESAFFGHIKGAFSGAHANQKGYFEQADGGTLFLDEIGDMPRTLQAKLLRALETGSIQPVGSEKSITIEVRILAATNQNLSAQIAQKDFRQDLYFRLAGYTLTLPALRDRREDVLLLTQHFIGLLSAEMGRELGGLSEDAMLALYEYSFPGNIRELKNIIEHALIKSGDGHIRKEHLQLTEWDFSLTEPSSASPQSTGKPTEAWNRNRQRVIERAQRKSTSDSNGADTIQSAPSDEERILDYLKSNESMGNMECRDLLAVDQNQAGYLLRKLCSYGLLFSEGDRRWRRYRLASPGSH